MERKNVYVGHRYVPLLMGEWDKTEMYEGLSIVTHQGDSYTSKKYVPAGIDITNDEYWVVTGNFNAQIEHYRSETERVSNELDDFGEQLDGLAETSYVNTELGKKADTSYVNTELGKKADTSYVNTELGNKADTTYVDDELESLNDYINDQLEKTPTTTTETTNYYVDKNGNDSNSGNSLNPFLTIERAIEEIPDIIRQGHEITIYIGEGDYNESVEISNKTVNGVLRVEGVTENRDNFKVYDIRVENVIGTVRISNLTTTKIDSGASIRFVSAQPYMRVANVKTLYDENAPGVDGRNLIGLLADYGSKVLVIQSDFSGKRYGMRSNYLSTITSSNNTGTLNHRGVGTRWGGIAFVYGTQPTGTSTNLSHSSGGIISKGRGFVSGLELGDYYIVDEKQSGHDSFYYKKKYNITDITSRSIALDDGDIIVLKMSNTSHGPFRLSINYGGQWGSQSVANQHFNIVLTGILNAGSVSNLSKHVIYSTNFNADDIDIVNTGNNQFDIRITTSGSLINRWACELESQMMRIGTAPTLNEVEIIEV